MQGITIGLLGNSALCLIIIYQLTIKFDPAVLSLEMQLSQKDGFSNGREAGLASLQFFLLTGPSVKTIQRYSGLMQAQVLKHINKQKNVAVRYYLPNAHKE